MTMLCEPTIRLCVCACFLLMLRMQYQGLPELSWRSLHCFKQIQALATPMQRQCKVVEKGATIIKCRQAFPSFPLISPHFPSFPLIFPHFPHLSRFSVACWILGYSGYGYFPGLGERLGIVLGQSVSVPRKEKRRQASGESLFTTLTVTTILSVGLLVAVKHLESVHRTHIIYLLLDCPWCT